MTVKSLEDTFVYRQLNSGDGISKSVIKILNEGIQLSKENLEEAFLLINKNFKYPLKYKVIDEVAKGNIVMMYSPQNTRIPTCMPFFLTRNKDGRVIAVVVVDLFGKMNMETKHVNIDTKKLYCILESALLALSNYHNSNLLSKRNVIITSGSSIYSNMFTRVLNKKYSLNVDKIKNHKVLFLSGKFYMLNMLRMNDSEMVFNYALRNCPGGANSFILKEVNDMLNPEDYKDLSTFIQALKRPELGLKMDDLTVRGYLESFINMYDGSALLALELFPYFMYNILSVVNGAYLNHQFILEDIVDRHGPKMYADLLDYNR